MRIRFSLTLCVLLGLPSSHLFGASPLHQRIDAAIDAGSGGPLSPPADDAEFLRRVSLDLNGIIPTATEAKQFLADKDPAKRTRLIDRLLARPQFARRLREAFTVMLLERRAGRTITDQAWNSYLEQSFKANKPWDKLVAEILAADGQDKNTAAAMRFMVDGGRSQPTQMTQDLARLFLGMDLQCARCHDHPNVKSFKQRHYYGLFAFVANSKLRGKFFIAAPDAKPIEFQSVFFPDQKKKTGPRLLDGKELPVPRFKKKAEAIAKPADKKAGLPAIPRFRPRLQLARQLTAATNRPFVRNSVNRIWFLVMGRGLVQPLDMLHKDNPPSHPQILDLLEQEFVKHKFDLKWLIRELCLTRTYQRSSRLPPKSKTATVKRHRYRAALAKPLAAEQMAWSLLRATGNLHGIQAKPKTGKAAADKPFSVKDYINDRIPPPDNITDIMALFSDVYGNPPGEAEVEFNPSAKHALFLMNDKLIFAWLKPRKGNLVATLAAQKNKQIPDHLYLSILTRLPTAAERAEILRYLQDHTDKTKAIQDLSWALLSSTEFRLNH